MSDVGHAGRTKALQTIESCLETYKLCTQTASYGIGKGGVLADPHRLQAVYDCAEANLMLANFLSRASRFHRPLAELCAEISENCAEWLSSLEHDDPQLRATYAACQGSARTCLELIGHLEEAKDDAHDEAMRETYPGSDAPLPPTVL